MTCDNPTQRAINLRKGTIVATFSALSYSAAVVFVRFAYRAGILPGTAILLRFTIATATVGVWLTMSRTWIRLPWRRVVPLFLLGFLAYTLLGATWFIALNRAPAWLVSLFTALSPLAVTLGSWAFLHDRVDRQEITALTVVLAGAGLLFGHGLEPAEWQGIALMALNLTVYTVYLLVGQRWTRGVPSAISTFWMTAGAALGGLTYALLSGQFSLGFRPDGWLWATFFGIVSTALAIMFLWQGISLIGPARTAIIGSLEPPLSILWSVLILGERLSPLQGIGGLLMLAGVILLRIDLASMTYTRQRNRR